MILGIFGVNMAQSVLHVIAGLFGLYVGIKGEGPKYNAILGWIALVVAVLGFIPGTNTLLLSLLNINMATTFLHVAIGIISLGVYYGAKK